MSLIWPWLCENCVSFIRSKPCTKTKKIPRMSLIKCVLSRWKNCTKTKKYHTKPTLISKNLFSLTLLSLPFAKPRSSLPYQGNWNAHKHSRAEELKLLANEAFKGDRINHSFSVFISVFSLFIILLFLLIFLILGFYFNS